MPRERLRPHNLTINWAYRCEIAGEPPAIIFDTARKMDQLWNELVWLHDRTPYRLLRAAERCLRDLAKEARTLEGGEREKGDDQAAEIYAAQSAAYITKAGEIKEAAVSIVTQSYQGFEPTQYLALRAKAKQLNQEARQAKAEGDTAREKRLRADAQEMRSTALKMRTLDIPLEDRINKHVQERGNELDLPVWCKWHVGDQFKNGLKAYANRTRFAPRRKFGLNSIHIEQRTDSGTGWPVDKLFERRIPFSIKPEVERGGDYDGWKAPGWIGLNGERIPLQVTMHRPFPDGAIVKRYSLLGKYERATKTWEWGMLFQIEIPPVNVLYPMTNCLVAADAGWRAHRDRAVGEDGIRVLTLFDGFEAYEVVIPFDLSNRRERRRHKEDPHKARIDLREAWKIKSQRDKWQEDCKAAIRKLDTSGWPAKAVGMLKGLTRMRADGLMRLRAILAEASLTCEPIEVWLTQDNEAWTKQRYIEKRWLRARNEILRVVASEIAEQCDELRWEGDLGLKDMAEDGGKKKRKRKENRAATGEWDERTTNDRMLEAAQKWRVLANLSKLRVWTREAMAKRKREIVDADTAYSSQICHQCNGKIEPSADLIVGCENGHLSDQDVNTTIYYWNQFPADLREVAVPLTQVKRSRLARIIRPVKI